MIYGSLQTVFGWRIRVSTDANPRSLRNFPMQANGAEMLRLACIFAIERKVEVCAPVHDALLICAPLDRLDADILATQEAMREASQIVLNGFALNTDASAVRYPHRYSDPRGKVMWDRVMRLTRSTARANATWSHGISSLILSFFYGNTRTQRELERFCASFCVSSAVIVTNERCPMAATNAERQASYQSRLKAFGPPTAKQLDDRQAVIVGVKGAAFMGMRIHGWARWAPKEIIDYFGMAEAIERYWSKFGEVRPARIRWPKVDEGGRVKRE
jgi:hypothetical protein